MLKFSGLFGGAFVFGVNHKPVAGRDVQSQRIQNLRQRPLGVAVGLEAQHPPLIEQQTTKTQAVAAGGIGINDAPKLFVPVGQLTQLPCMIAC